MDSRGDVLFEQLSAGSRESWLAPVSRLPGLAVTLVACVVAIALVPISTDIGLFAPFAILGGLVACGIILARPFIGVFLLVFLAQLLGLVEEVFGGVGPFVYEGLLVLTFAAIVIQAPMRPARLRWGGNPLSFRLGAVFVLCGVLSVLFSEFRDNAAMTLLQIASLLLVFFVIIAMTDTKSRVTALVVALLASTAISGFVSLLGYINGDAIVGVATGRRLAGASSTDPTTTANVMLISTLLGTFLMFRLAKLRAFSLGAFVFGICGIVLSYSRSALMVLVAGFGLLGFLLRKSRYAPAGFMLAAILSVSLIPAVPAGVWERFADFANPSQDFTLGRRWGYHVIGFDLLVKNPVTGIGPGTFGDHYQAFEYRFEEGRRLTTRDLHNLYLGVAVEYGLLGFCIFAWMLASVLLGLNRVRQSARDPTLAIVAQGLLAGFGVFLVTAITLPALDNKMLWVTLGLSTAIISLVDRSAGSIVKNDEPTD